MQLDVRSGISEQGDADTTDVGITAGFEIAEGRGNVLLSAGYTDRDVLFGKDRDFYQLGVLSSFIGTGTYVPSPTNLPQQAVVNAVFAAYGVAPGAVLNSRSLGFNDNGTLFGQIGAVNYQGPDDGVLQHDRRHRAPAGDLPGIRRSIRWSASRSSASSTSTSRTQSTAYGQFLYNKTTATGQVGWSPTLFVVPTVPVTNPFIPADLRTILASRPHTGRGFHAQPALHGPRTSRVPDRLHRRRSTSSACAATCRSRTGAGTSMARTTRPMSSRRRTRRS